MNTETKKQNGVVFTPEWVADFMIDEALNSRKIRGNEKILDAGCGEGVFAVIAAQKFSKLSALYDDYYEVYGDEDAVWDIDELEELRAIGQKFMDIFAVNFKKS